MNRDKIAESLLPAILAQYDVKDDSYKMAVKRAYEIADYFIGTSDNSCKESLPSENGNTPYKAPLTNAEIRSIIDHMGIPVKTGNTATKFARAIEAAHGIV